MSSFDDSDGPVKGDDDVRILYNFKARGNVKITFEGPMSEPVMQKVAKLAMKEAEKEEDLDPIKTSQERQELEDQRKQVDKLWPFITDTHRNIILYVSTKGSARQSILTKKFTYGDSEKWRGQVTGLSRLCNNRGIVYPLHRRKSKDGSHWRYRVNPMFAIAFKEKSEDEDDE